VANRSRMRATRRRAVRGALRAAAPLLVTLLATLSLLLGLSAAFYGATAHAETLPVGSAQVAAAQAAGAQTPGEVWVTKVSGIIDPALSGYLVDTMADAAAAQAAALVIQLDTPGGLDSSMRAIIQAEIDSPIPIVFYVYPQGARAASAGVYMLYGSDVAAMAPQTNLGAATPVSLNGGMDETMARKVTNDAAAYIIGLANSHGRNAEWAEKAVRDAVSLPAEDALSQNVIEFVAADLPALLQAIDGYVTTPKNLTLHTAGAPVKHVGMGFITRFLHAIANPDIAYILMTLGMLGLILELATPGLGASGVTGVIALILALYSFQVLPVNLAGIALIVVALILFVAEIKIQSHGILGIGGAAALVLGGLLLFDTSAPFLRVSWQVLTVAVVFVLGFFFLVVTKAARAIRLPHATGLESMVGVSAVVITPLLPEGTVRVHGEIWKARSEVGNEPKGQTVEVVSTQGLTLLVRPKPPEH
jgi:membrane-bound serine protease (ClpP class)